MIASRADVSKRSEEGAGGRPRPRDDGTVRRRLKFRYDAPSGMSLGSKRELASYTSASEWDDDEERRLDSSSTKVLSSGIVSASNVGSASEVQLDSELVLALALLVLVVGEGKGVLEPNGSWWWW